GRRRRERAGLGAGDRPETPAVKEIGVAAFELRPMKTGEILDGAITLMRRQFGVLFGIAVVCEGLPAVLDIYIDLTGGSAAQPGLALLERLLNLFGTMLVTGATV